MATTYSDLGAQQFAATTNLATGTTSPTALCDHVATVPVTYTLLGTETAADIVKLVRLPKGVRVVSHLSKVYAENPGTTLTFTIGDADDADRYSTTITASAGGAFDFVSTGGPELAGYKVGDATDDDRWVNLTVSTASTLTAGQKITVVLAYTSE